MPKKKRARGKKPSGGAVVRLLEYEITYEPIPDARFEALPRETREAIADLYCRIEDEEDPHEAIDEVRAMIEKHPDLPMLYNYLGAAYQKAGRYEEAERAIEDNYRRNPEYLFARMNYAEVCLRRRDHEKALELLKGKFDLKLYYPERSRFHITEFTGFMYVVGKYHACTGNREAALDVYESLRQVAPDHPATKQLREILHPSLVRKLLRRITKRGGV